MLLVEPSEIHVIVINQESKKHKTNYQVEVVLAETNKKQTVNVVLFRNSKVMNGLSPSPYTIPTVPIFPPAQGVGPWKPEIPSVFAKHPWEFMRSHSPQSLQKMPLFLPSFGIRFLSGNQVGSKEFWDLTLFSTKNKWHRSIVLDCICTYLFPYCPLFI